MTVRQKWGPWFHIKYIKAPYLDALDTKLLDTSQRLDLNARDSKSATESVATHKETTAASATTATRETTNCAATESSFTTPTSVDTALTSNSRRRLSSSFLLASERMLVHLFCALESPFTPLLRDGSRETEPVPSSVSEDLATWLSNTLPN